MLELGIIGQDEAALAALRKARVSPATLLARHQRREAWDISPHLMGFTDEELGEDKVNSFFRLPTGDVIWVSTHTRVPVTVMLVMPAEQMAELYGL